LRKHLFREKGTFFFLPCNFVAGRYQKSGNVRM
jgi:hypothetical protein